MYMYMYMYMCMYMYIYIFNVCASVQRVGGGVSLHLYLHFFALHSGISSVDVMGSAIVHSLINSSSRNCTHHKEPTNPSKETIV